MNLPDSNVWLALTLSKHPFHGAASAWISGEAAKSSIRFCRSTQQSFLRLLTTEKLMAAYGLPPMTNAAAWELYERLLSDTRIDWADEPGGVESRWKDFAARGTASPKMWMDAYLAAFALAGKFRLITTDHGFQQYKGLDPLILGKAISSG
jgi:uncharacterized protein